MEMLAMDAFAPGQRHESPRPESAYATIQKQNRELFFKGRLVSQLPIILEATCQKKGKRFGFWSSRHIVLKSGLLLAFKKQKQMDDPACEPKMYQLRNYSVSLQAHSPTNRVILLESEHEQIPLRFSRVSLALTWYLELSKQTLNVTRDDFKSTKLLGEGGYGRVWLAEYLPAHTQVALKQIRKPNAGAMDFTSLKRAVDHLIDERSVLEYLSQHPVPYVISLQHCFQDDQSWYFTFEYCSRGVVAGSRSEPDQKQKYPRQQIQTWLAQCIIAIQGLHDHGIIHRDIKPDNLFLDSQNNIRLGDFGLATRLQRNAHGKYLRDKSFCGTKYYMAPEMLRGDGSHAFGVDYWSLGVVAYELLLGQLPFAQRSKDILFETIINDTPSFEEAKGFDAPDEVTKSFLAGLLEKYAHKRLGLREHDDIRQHAFFNGIDWATLEAASPVIPVPDRSLPSNLDTPLEINANLMKSTTLTDRQSNSPHNIVLFKRPSKFSLDGFEFIAPSAATTTRAASPASSDAAHETRTCSPNISMDENSHVLSNVTQ